MEEEEVTITEAMLSDAFQRAELFDDSELIWEYLQDIVQGARSDKFNNLKDYLKAQQKECIHDP